MRERHDLDAVMGTFGVDPRYDDEPWGAHHAGREAVRGHDEDLFRAAPDLRIDILGRHATEEAVILECVIAGTHRGAWRGLPPTGRRISFPICAVYTFTDGDELAGERIYCDRATVLRQLGVLHDPEGPLGRLLTALAHPVTVARVMSQLVSRPRRESHGRW